MKFQEIINNRILVIDDDEKILDIFSDIFSLEVFTIHESKDEVDPEDYNKRFDLTKANQGNDGYNIIKKSISDNKQFAVAFVDMRMPPGWDGFKTARKIRQIDDNIYIIIVTAYADRTIDELNEVLKHNFLLVQKPFSVKEILQVARNFCQSWNRDRELEKHQNKLEELVQIRTKDLEKSNFLLQDEVTERRLLVKQLKIYHDHLEELVRKRTNELEEKQAQLAHSGRLALVGEMATGVAHELNQPLTIIHCEAQLMQYPLKDKDKFIDSIKESASEIIAQIERATDIIDNVRTFARVDIKSEGKMNLIGPVSKSLMFFEQQFKHRDILLETNFENDCPLVNIHPQRFEQIVVNFLSNARFAIEKRAQKSDSANYKKKVIVKITNDPKNKKLIFEVIDNGIGMDKIELESCTKPFFTTKDETQGTGLGLSVVSNLLKEFDGILEIESKKHIGTTMRVLIPVTE